MSEHAMGLQRSQYLCIDDTIEKDRVYANNKKQIEIMKNGGDQTQQKKININLRFCPDAEVKKNRQKQLVSKSQFYIKLNHLKSKG